MSRSITIHEEAVGVPREGMQDTVFASVSYSKGRGYVLTARVEKRAEGVRSWMPFSGIAHNERLADAKRFSAKKLQAYADTAKTGALVGALPGLKAELARRIAEGEQY